MFEQSTTRDLVGRWRGSFEAINSRDMDAALSVWAPDGVWDVSPMGLGVYEGRTATRQFFEDWLSAYEEYEIRAEEIHDLGNGVTWAVVSQQGSPAGSGGTVHLHYGAVAVWEDGLTARVTNYGDPAEARAAAERLAQERRSAMSENRDLVHSIFADREREQ